MNAKSLLQTITLAAVMLAVSAWQAAAQVYSLNVVGYYNVQLTPGWNVLANQFIVTNYNINCVLLPGMPADGSLLYRFNPVTQNYYDAGTYFDTFGWCPLSGDTNDPVLNLPPGEGFMIWTPQAWTATFVGEVAQGHLVNPLPAYYSMKASMVPQTGLLQTDLIFPPYAGDQVWGWVGAGFSAYTYNNGAAQWLPAEPTVDYGRGFFLYRAPEQATADHWWVRDFYVQFAPSSPGSDPVVPPPPTLIRSLLFRSGNAVLVVQGAAGAAYDVQFSTDRASWKTVAISQTAPLWQEQARGGSQGFYRLAVNP